MNNSRLYDVNARIGDVYARIGDTHSRIDETNARISALREELSAVFMANLRRVEEIIDARLTQIEKELDRR